MRQLMNKSKELTAEVTRLLPTIESEADHCKAVDIVEALIEDGWDKHVPLIDHLSDRIGQWENQYSEFAEFNRLCDSMDTDHTDNSDESTPPNSKHL